MSSVLEKSLTGPNRWLSTRIKRAETQEELVEFMQKNPATPALDLNYLKNNLTYVLYHQGEIVGGFVYATTRPLRSVEVIKSAKIRQACYDRFKGHKIAEITGLWLDQRYRKSLFSKLLWFSIAVKTFTGDADYYLFVSKSKGLVQAMNYPACTYHFLTCEERLPHNEYAEGTFFLAEKKHTLKGMLQGLYYFAFKPHSRPKENHGLASFQIDPASL